MKRTMMKRFLSLVFISIFGATMCYPMDTSKLNTDLPELKDEIHYPNGTVVGKYSYIDNDGNPIHVKYYADDASYGVELKSIKQVFNTSSEEPAWQSNNFDTLKPIEPPLDMGTEYLTQSSPVINTQNVNVQQKDAKKPNPKIKKNSGYETFYQNDINTPQQYDKNKVKVYLDKEKRIIRQALDNYQIAKYCDRY